LRSSELELVWKSEDISEGICNLYDERFGVQGHDVQRLLSGSWTAHTFLSNFVDRMWAAEVLKGHLCSFTYQMFLAKQHCAAEIFRTDDQFSAEALGGSGGSFISLSLRSKELRAHPSRQYMQLAQEPDVNVGTQALDVN
jgi:hypothetical protein